MRRGQEHPTQSDWTYCTISKPLNTHVNNKSSVAIFTEVCATYKGSQYFCTVFCRSLFSHHVSALVAYLIGPIGLLMNMHNLNY